MRRAVRSLTPSPGSITIGVNSIRKYRNTRAVARDSRRIVTSKRSEAGRDNAHLSAMRYYAPERVGGVD